MRDIKFRAWSQRDKIMSPPFGLFDMDGGYCIPFERSIDGDYNDEKCILMQYTGLHDKNGKEIYEGDIVNVRNWGSTDEILHTGKIVWDEQAASWQFDPWFDVDEYDRFRNIEVIGNIYEKP